MSTEFIYLSEQDTIDAGVLDAPRCVDVCSEVFELLAKGDYLMGGSNHNSHGMGLVFPKESPFPNMPVAGPDRRFVAMPAYLGGRFDICGNKWYGSNAANPSKGLPRSVLTVMLNNKETGEPLTLMSANLLSAARTGAVPAVASKYLARKDSEVISMIGCGPINQSCLRHILSQMPKIKKVICFDLFTEKAESCAKWISETFHLDAAASTDLQATLSQSDITTIAASRLKPVNFKKGWIKPGTTVLVTGPIMPDTDFWLNTRIVFDHIGLHESYVEEAIASGDKTKYYAGVIGGPIYHLIDDHQLPSLQDSDSIGQVITGQKPGRKDDREIITFVACGMSVFDVGWGYEIYQNALKNNIGQKLLLWDTPYQLRS